jgi:hypothetical protein
MPTAIAAIYIHTGRRGTGRHEADVIRKIRTDQKFLNNLMTSTISYNRYQRAGTHRDVNGLPK